MTGYDDTLMGMVPFNADGPTELIGFIRAGAARFTEPFFDQALEKLTISGSIWTTELTFTQLRNLVGAAVPSPRALVLHTGRCGSTLLTRMLSHDRATLPVSEPRAVGLTHRYALSEPDNAANAYQAVADMLVVLDRFAASRKQRPVIKLSSWETAGIAGIRDMVGDVPIVMMHRPVAEVVASEMHSPTGWFDWLSGDRTWMKEWAPHVAVLPESASHEEVYAGMWASEVDAALSLPGEQTLFVAYADLKDRPAEVLDAVAAHIGNSDSWNRTTALSEMPYYAKSRDPLDQFDPANRHARPELPADVVERMLEVVGDAPDRLRERSRAQMQTTGGTVR